MRTEFAFLFWFGVFAAVPKPVSSFDLAIIHTNDVHARFEAFNNRMTDCTDKDRKKNTCFGGAARRKTAVNQVRANYSNTIFLDGGDQFQGTIWYSVFKWKPVAKIMKELEYEAMAFGNHEFDDGLDGLVPFAKNISDSFVIVNSNINSAGTDLEGTYYTSYEKTVGGEVIGIVGYTTPETKEISYPGPDLKFQDEITALKQVVNELVSIGGINKIIAIGHSGISIDREICKSVPGVDIVIGGHTNTFLYSGEAPSRELAEGEYPEVFKDTGAPCLVVQDYGYGKYLGFLQVQFDATGKLISWNGNPILLDNRFEEDGEILAILEPYKKQIETIKSIVLGATAVTINASTKVCRTRECNLGNFLTDAAVYNYLITYPDSTSWTKAAICLWNGGGMRDFIADPWDNITLNDLHTIMPFGNMLERIKISGRNIRLSLEHGVTNFSLSDPKGRFLQVSGLKVVYNIKKPIGQRVVSVEARCSQCNLPRYDPLDDNKIYSVISTTYLLDGGDGHIYLKNYAFRDNAELLNIDVIKAYLENHSPILPQLDGRIKFVKDDEISCKTSGVFRISASHNCFVLLIVLLLCLK